MEANRLVLGTAQIGLPYGIANVRGQIDIAAAAEMFRLASAKGVVTLDTAIAYGESEARLGSVGVANWLINSKLPAVPKGCRDVAGWVQREIAGSLSRLGVQRLNGVLLHRPLQLLEPYGEELYKALLELKLRGVAVKIGISVYGPQEIEDLHTRFHFDMVQAPLNIVDRRLLDSGWIAKLSAEGVEVQMRSVFMQGLLLMVERPIYFDRWSDLWSSWQTWLEEQALTPLEACLRYAASVEGVDRVVVGFDSLQQLEQIIAILDAPPLTVPAELTCQDLDLIDPSRWTLV